MSSLKGPKHGGANIKVMEMMQNIRENVSDWDDTEELRNYLEKILNKEAFDHKGLIYGMGHAVYSISDPRERVFKSYVEKLAAEKGREKDMRLYQSIEKLAPEIIAEKRHIYKGVSPNVDFYSGFVYDMLGIPQELYTPLFAVARIVGWSAHRIEELIDMDKIIRPAYLSVMEEKEDLDFFTTIPSRAAADAPADSKNMKMWSAGKRPNIWKNHCSLPWMPGSGLSSRATTGKCPMPSPILYRGWLPIRQRTI